MPLTVMTCCADPLVKTTMDPEELTEAWEKSASVLKEVLKTDATIMDVELCFMRDYFPETLSLTGHFLLELLEGA
jgi:hypothetical protein